MEITPRRQIRELPRQVADKIAAGEVVDRPVSIVKELVENSIDAGATSITVEIKNGGKTYLRVTDNGCGIESGQAELAFKRHATSKIEEAEDLNRIETLGFRGEALASIAAVSRAELITKTREADSGYKLRIEGGEFVEKSDTGCPDGTTLVISDLFYNTPARMKFLKPDNTESTLIIDFMSKMALAYPSVKIRLINNCSVLFSTTGKGEIYTNILTIYSREIGEKLIRVDAEEEGLRLIAFVSPPSQSRTNRRNQIFFVNGRSVGSKVLERAVADAYTEKLFEGRYPIAFLFLSVSPERLDVNIHPNKKEVRFDDEKAVRDFVGAAIRRGLSTREAVPEIRRENVFKNNDWRGNGPGTGKEDQISIHSRARSAEAPGSHGMGQDAGSRISQPEKEADIKSFLSTRPRPDNGRSEGTAWKQKEEERGNLQISDCGTSCASYQAPAPQGNGAPEIPGAEEAKGGRALEPFLDSLGQETGEKTQERQQRSEQREQRRQQMQEPDPPKMPVPEPPVKKPFDINTLRPTGAIFNTYITAIDDEYFYLIDQHAAHERIFYEQLLAAYNREERHSQMLLTSFVVDLPFAVKNNAADFLVYLERIGYRMEEFGVKAYIVKEIPAMMELSEAESFLEYFLDNISADFSLQDPAKVDKIIMKACKSAVKAHDHLAAEEIQALIRDLAKTNNPFSCPHGRPTFIKLSKYEIEKLFKRV
ncbi:DNA mismatch repair endonuclease MutL [Bacilliculturomica massiliensis]|uniref:DNA mismatch repair endonuclease MutL n=1 Tax=Bacilliculturomica massiliensis TaxID=1917867 RepID=UPI0013EF1F3F|nr:DNA mismatch repair endonuclease MutL [Bacilliculturomica massiliensis]